MKPFSLVAAVIFLLIALAHLYRVAVGFPVTVGGADIGQAVSWAGLVVASVLSIGLFREAFRGNPPHHITLVADFEAPGSSRIVVGPKTHLPKGSKEHFFKFKLDDKTNKNVRFARLVSADDCSTCPPDTTKAHDQIDQVSMSNPGHGQPATAEFRDKNDNTQPFDVSYQWEFTCDAGATVLPFDPIISNGGRV
jgi:hypothetical protein